MGGSIMMNKKIFRGRLLKTGSAVTSVGITMPWVITTFARMGRAAIPFFASSWQSGSNR